ncbi:two-component response regulator 24-like [Corylus avellana]|uniref:two-component response regulator 24-like n=1 Tax=Corylus avellana TaxID=13451 RepID=UPI001E23A007|nr:two-component response regulator 24-like [Corylus avellana]
MERTSLPGPSSKKLTALVVDDTLLTRLIHRNLLAGHGIKAQLAENGKDAVDFIRSGQRFDLILMDKEMPVMDGTEATKELRSMGIHCFIAGLSAVSSAGGKEEFKQSGLDLFQEKPLDDTKLTFILQKFKNHIA